nr:uncharacterized protein LOC132779950 [Anolis sagrei ordinatus]
MAAEDSDCEDPQAALLRESPPPRRTPAPPPASLCQWALSPVIYCWNLCRRTVVGAAHLCVRLWRLLFCRRKPENLLLGGSQNWEKRRCWLWSWLWSWIEAELPIRVRVTGQTGDCEHQFLKKVSDCVSQDFIRLKKGDSSAQFLNVFCPVVSRVGTDMQNALGGLHGESKAILVMLHHMPKESNRFVDTKQQASHPAVVRTVHTRYTLEDGLYPCQVNKEAVEDVAKIFINHCKGVRRIQRFLALSLRCVFWSTIAIAIAVKSGIVNIAGPSQQPRT